MKTYILGFLFVHILSFKAGALSPDVCESCKHRDDCPQYGEMTKYQQQQWVKEFPCQTPDDNADDSVVPGFSTFAKGDYVCCPSSKVWGIKEDSGSPQENQNSGNGGDVDSFYVPEYLWYQNPYNRNEYSTQRSPWDYQPNNMYGNNYANNGVAQCTPQRSPPSPKSGCCGVDNSDSYRITDFQQYSSVLGLQNKPSHYQRAKRDADIDLLGITFEDRIAGGRAAALDQYPWIAYLSIRFLSEGQLKSFACGGSLISSQFILTAAHCMVNQGSTLQSVDVILAEYDKRTFPRDCVMVRGGQTECIDNVKIPVEDVIIHPNYIEQYLINDIALLRLRDFVPLTRYIGPICLPEVNIDSPEFSKLPLATAGWGMNMTVQSDIKQYTVINLVPKNQCQAHYLYLTDGHICASGRNNEDTCKGDSGGPLMMMYHGKYHVVGIVSGKTASYPCGTPVPSLYTNVYSYLDWIRSYVK